MGSLRRLFLFLGFIVAVLIVSVPALAEFDSEKQTEWGVETKGNSDTISRWKALSWEVDQVDGTIFIGGNYLDVTNGIQTHRQPYLAAFDADTGAWQSWFRPEVGSAVFAMQPTSDGGLLVGGEIDTWNGETVGALVKIDPATGERWPGFQTRVFGGNSVVRDLKLEEDGYVYAVGSFTTATSGNGPIAANGAVRFNPLTGAIDTNWLPDVDERGAAWGVDRSPNNNTVYIAGFFQSVNGDTDARGFVGLDDAGTVVVDRANVPFNGCIEWDYCSQLYDVEVTESGHVWVAGVEHALYVLNESDLSLVKHHYTGCNPAITDCVANWVGGEFQEIERIGDRIYSTCHCWTDMYSDDQVIAHRQPTGTHSKVNSIAAFSAVTGEHLPEFSPKLTGDSGGFGLHQNPSDGCLWAVGGFEAYGAAGGPQPPARDVVRICDEDGRGPAASPQAEPPPPLGCTVVGDAAGVTIQWTNTDTATKTIIYRKVNDGSIYWHGRVDTTDPSSFTAIPKAASVSEYFVQHVYPASQRSVQLPCGAVDLTPNLTPATNCSISLSADNRPVLSWTPGNDNNDYIVRRSVDDGPSYWRARVDDPAFTGVQLDTGRNYTYVVQARSVDRTVAENTDCGSVSLTLPSPDVVQSCSAVLLSNSQVRIDWNDGAATDRFIVRRSTNGVGNYWRGRVDSADGIAPLNFTDSVGEGNSYAYSVTAIGIDGSTTPATPCDPSPVVVEAPPAVTAASCDVTFDGSAYTVNWTYQDGAAPSDAVLQRIKVGVGNWAWRTRTAASTFVDTAIEPGHTYDYRVLLIDADGRRSETTPCELG